MYKEPIILTLLRYVILAGILFLLGMLYWSSLLTEERLQTISKELSELRGQGRFSIQDPAATPISEKRMERQSLADPSLPNLLAADPFYEETLPRLLGKGFHPFGVLKQAAIGKPENLHPFSPWAVVSDWISLVTGTVGTIQFGKSDVLAPDLAVKMEQRLNKASGKPELWVHLRDDIYWHPLNPSHLGTQITLAPHFFKKHRVTAHDFKFFYDALMNPHLQTPGAVAIRNTMVDIESFEVVDDVTFVVRWKTKEFPSGPKMRFIAIRWTSSLRPLPSFVYQYFPDGTKMVADDSDPNTYRQNSVWAQNFANHWASQLIISCGPWLFNGMTDQMIRFKRNPDYYNPLAALTQEIHYALKDTTDAIWQGFKAGEFDDITIPPNQLLEVETFLQSAPYERQKKEGLAVKQLNYVSQIYSYIAWNETNPLFKSKKVRQALTMAIDRKRIINQILNGMGIEINGTFLVNSSSYDKSIIPWPFDPDRARQQLAQEGWYDSDGDGIIDKEIDGKRRPFVFSLTYYVKNQTSKAICEYISTALKNVGIVCNLRGVDTADLSAVFDDKSFDALNLAWSVGYPPDDPRQIWSSEGAKEKGSSNAIGFVNSEIDRLIDLLDYEYDPQKRIELYHQFDAIIHDEQPYTFLYTPKVSLLFREYLQNVFIPAQRQDLIPGADIEQPQQSIFWIRRR